MSSQSAERSDAGSIAERSLSTELAAGGSIRRKISRLLAPTSMAFVVLLVLGHEKREWNFDCIPYAAAARALLGEPKELAHALVYRDLRAVAPAPRFDELTVGSPYRKSVARNPDVLAAQLPMYWNKPAYVVLVAMGVASGWTDSISACFAICAVTYIGLSMLLADALGRVVHPALGWVLALGIMLAPPLRELGKIATPDALSALVCFAAVASLIVYRRRAIGCGLLVASILVRPDNALLCLAVLAWLAMDPRTRLHAALGCLGLVVVLLGYAAFIPMQSWTALMVHTFLHRLNTVTEMRSSVLTSGQYVDLLRTGIHGHLVLHRSMAVIFLLISLTGCGIASRSERGGGVVALHLLVWVAAIAHYVGFPLLADRFFVPHYLTVTTLTVSSLYGAFSVKRLATSSKAS